MDGLCKESSKERQMEKDRGEYLICIRKVPKCGTNEASFALIFFPLFFFFSITGGAREDASECVHNVIIGFP